MFADGFAAVYFKSATLTAGLDVPPTVAVATTEFFALSVPSTTTGAA